MTDIAPTLAHDSSRLRSWPFYYGWVNVVVASVAMTATLPGRTHGLGLITEPLLADLNLQHVWFARINLVSALAGALFAVPVGWLVDRYGVRPVLTAVTLALGLAVCGMSRVDSAALLLVTLLLVRGLGQSALSVASMAAIGKWFSRRLGLAMGLFAVLLTFGFIASVIAMGAAIERVGWRSAWQALGLALIALAPVFWIFTRSTPESCGLLPDAPARDVPSADVPRAFTLRQAIATRAFWVVALGTSAFNLVWSGVTLFNESMLVERGLDRQLAVEIMAILTGTGLLANLVCGAFATRRHVVRVLAAGMALLAASLALFPAIDSPTLARVYAALIGLSGGAVTVVFFAAWGHLFGRARLGEIQGFAQVATVLASALGPVAMAEGRAFSGSYSATFYVLAAVTGTLGLAALLTPLPAEESEPAEPAT